MGAKLSTFGDFAIFLKKCFIFKPTWIKLMFLKRGIEISIGCKNMIKLGA